MSNEVDILDAVALLDMDGTVADYDGAMIAALETLRAPEEPPILLGHSKDPPHIEARKKLIKGTPGFWRRLPRIERGFEIVEDLREFKFELNVLTKGPSGTLSAWTEKAEWCREHLPDALVAVTEWPKAYSYGRVLVDDWPEYFMPWLHRRPRGIVIAVAQPWNEGVAHQNLIRYDGTNRDQVREALRWARTRS